jgi:hypothetical protein
MTEFVPAWITATTVLYFGVATLALLITTGWRLSASDGGARLSQFGLADALRDRAVVGICVLLAVRFVAAVAGLPPLAEMSTVAGLLFVAAAAQIETMKTVAHSSGPRGETV